MRRAVRLLLLGLIAAGILLLFVFPLRTLIDQNHQISSTRQQIAALSKAKNQLAARIKSAESPSQLEQTAHQDFGLVMPGQQSYTVVPHSTVVQQAKAAARRKAAAEARAKKAAAERRAERKAAAKKAQARRARRAVRREAERQARTETRTEQAHRTTAGR